MINNKLKNGIVHAVHFASAMAFALAMSGSAVAATNIYVAVEDPNAGDTAVEGRGTEALPYRTLQAAMEHEGLKSGDTVLVKRGTYSDGGKKYTDSALTSNRVIVKPGVTLKSVDGAKATIIKGASGVRCAYLGIYATLSGFTLADGQTTGSTEGESSDGGGVFGNDAQYSAAWADQEPRVVDCVFTNCYSSNRGGANAGKSLFIRCQFIDCTSKNGTGVISTRGAAQFYNCFFKQPVSSGSYSLYQAGLIVNCTFIGGGAAMRSCGDAYNCIFLQRYGPVSGDRYLNADVRLRNCHIRCAAGYFPDPARCDDACTMEVPESTSDPSRGFRLFGNFAPMRGSSAHGACTDYDAYKELFPSAYKYEPYYGKDLHGNPRVTSGETVFDAGCVELDETRWYVDAVNGSDSYVGDGKGTADHPYKTLQAAMENPALGPGQVVVAMPGVYNSGGVPYGDGSLTNRVSVPQDVTLWSASGCDVTVIEGASASPGTTGVSGLGAGAVRAVKLGANSILRGFTIRNGYTTSEDGAAYYGGGVSGEKFENDSDKQSMVYDCRIEDCFARRGAAVSTVVANRCHFSNCGASEFGIANLSSLYNCVFGAQQRGSYAASYCEKVRNCSFISTAGISYATYFASAMGIDSNRAYNCVFCCGVQPSANYTACAFATNSGLNADISADVMGEGSFKGTAEEFKIRADGSLMAGSMLVDRGVSSLYPFADCGWRDAFGVPRALNRYIDIGASEYDWRIDFKRALGGNSGWLSVIDASSNVVLNAGGGVKIDGDGMLSVAWTNKNAVLQSEDYYYKSAAVDGTLVCSQNGAAAQVVPDGDKMLQSDERLIKLDFGFSGDGYATLSSFRHGAGMVIMYR